MEPGNRPGSVAGAGETKTTEEEVDDDADTKGQIHQEVWKTVRFPRPAQEEGGEREATGQALEAESEKAA